MDTPSRGLRKFLGLVTGPEIKSGTSAEPLSSSKVPSSAIEVVVS
jgi:hypothetical protein